MNALEAHEVEVRSHQWHIKIWYFSNTFEHVSNITRMDAEAIAAEAEINDRVQAWEIHAPGGRVVDAARH